MGFGLPSRYRNKTRGLNKAEGSTSSKSTTWQSFWMMLSPPYRLAASASFCCSVTRLMTRVTGKPLSTAGWKVSNLQYLHHTQGATDQHH